MIAFALSSIYILTNTYIWLVSLWLFLGFLMTTYSLVRYVEKANRELRYFLLSVAQGDFSNTYSYKTQNELNYAFNTLNDVLKNLRNEKASNLIYLQTVVEHIQTAIICFDKNYKITLHNKSAKALFNKEQLASINNLAGISGTLVQYVKSLKNGEKELVKVNLGGSQFNLSINVTEFWIEENYYKLVSFQDIRSELEIKELESWQKLIRVLTHEIKNSVIPISTLSDVVTQLIKDKRQQFDKMDESETFADIIGGLETIQARSEGLANFVKTYDQLTKIPKPKLVSHAPDQLIHKVVSLFRPELEQNQISIVTDFQDSLEVEVDLDLIDQVLVNLFKNAIEALKNKKQPSIHISTHKTFDQIEMTIMDNGQGIDEETMENIFVPFFTTKSSGSGIGLALSRQIMRAHKGGIKARSTEQGTYFTLSFPLKKET